MCLFIIYNKAAKFCKLKGSWYFVLRVCCNSELQVKKYIILIELFYENKVIVGFIMRIQINIFPIVIDESNAMLNYQFKFETVFKCYYIYKRNKVFSFV